MINSKLRADGAAFTARDIDAAFRVLTWIRQEMVDQDEQLLIVNQRDHLLRLAKGIRASRAERTVFFREDLFGEASWDILLALFIAGEEGYEMKMTAVCYESGVPMTTALRWIDRLIELGHIVKRANAYDARSSLLELSPETVERLREYLERVQSRHMSKSTPSPDN